MVYNQKVLVVTSPSDNSEQEKFLGYTWSNRKGDEGIKLKEDSKIKCGVLYNTNDEENSLACYVKDSFLGIYRNEGSLQKYINCFSLSDMLDFTRTTFDKAIKTQGIIDNEQLKIKSKYPLVKIKDICELGRGKVMDKVFTFGNLFRFRQLDFFAHRKTLLLFLLHRNLVLYCV